MSIRDNAPVSRIQPRTAALAFLPLVVLVVAALVTNTGALMTRDAHAASVTINASIVQDKHLATNICTGASTGETSGPSAGAGGSLAFTNLAANTATTRTCSIGFGTSNSTSAVNMRVSAASATFGWTGFTAAGACGAPSATTSKVGIDASASGTGSSTNALIDCATAGQFQSIPTSQTTACTVTGTTTDATCVLAVNITTGTATAGALAAGVLTVNAA